MMLKPLIAAAAAILAIAATPPAPQGSGGKVVRTAAGSHVVGNPEAKDTLVEFVSYTCSHCAAFEREGDDLMKAQFVASGRLKFEVRHRVLNVVDMTVATGVHCLPTAKFFAGHSAMLRTQDKWLAKATAASQSQQARWRTGTPRDKMRAVASDIGLYDMLGRHGLSRSQLDQCFGDPKIYQPITDQTVAASKRGINSTPTFELNGVRLAAISAREVLSVLDNALKP
mgnify:CR=1 FL=1